MKILSAQYLISAPSLKDCPDYQGLPEIVLVGRSNVGKSSFINCLTGRKNLARTSNTPGKTRYINFYQIDYQPQPEQEKAALLLVDLPGYGYAKISKTEQEKWRKNLEAYLTKRDTIVLIVQLIDSRHGPQENDLQMAGWLQYYERPTQVILTKTDKISRNEVGRQVAQTARLLPCPPAEILTFSAETGHGRDPAWHCLLGALQAVQVLEPVPVIPESMADDGATI